MADIEVRAEVTTTEFEAGTVWGAPDDDRTRTLLANGYVTRTDGKAPADDAPDREKVEEDIAVAAANYQEANGGGLVVEEKDVTTDTESTKASTRKPRS